MNESLGNKVAGLCAGFSLFFALTAAGQIPGGTSPTGVNAAFMKLFGNFPAFTAKVDAQVLDKEKTEWVRMPLDLTALDSKFRIDIDMQQIKSRDLPEAALSSLKQAGMVKVTSLILPEKKATYVIYPGASSYLSIPFGKEDTEVFGKDYKLQTTAQGKETVEGHPCTKNKVTITGPSGPLFEATTWNASDLKDFPVQVEIVDKGNTMIMHFSQVQFEKPNASKFQLPTGYTEYKDPQEMMMGIMKKMMPPEKK